VRSNADPCSQSSLEILKDWIALIDEDGWVAREQILGDESRSKVSP
jgi:mannosyl-oligosaccharide glucosidase